MKGAYIMSANELTSKVRELKELKAMASTDDFEEAFVSIVKEGTL